LNSRVLLQVVTFSISSGCDVFYPAQTANNRRQNCAGG
jgi:hypothetical protein